MSRDWTPDELHAASAAMKAAGHMSYEEFSESLEKGTFSMKTYRRTEQCKGYLRITEVDESGRYEKWSEWPNGGTTDYYKTTIQEMGWASLNQFLAVRPGFKEKESNHDN